MSLLARSKVYTNKKNINKKTKEKNNQFLFGRVERENKKI